MFVITLTPFEQRIVRALAKERMTQNVNAGVVNQRRSQQSDDEIHLNGAGAELAFCRLFNVYPDFSTTPRRGGHDAIWTGLTVDIKATPYSDGRLMVMASKHPSDVYALMVGTFPAYRFAGMTTGSNLLRSKNLMDLGHGPTYVLSQSALSVDMLRKDHQSMAPVSDLSPEKLPF